MISSPRHLLNVHGIESQAAHLYQSELNWPGQNAWTAQRAPWSAAHAFDK